ncbi:MAG: hypothetical protein H6707_12555 [Deltaproteobacteria bacterium]|nr:hypothetical protein [Deltaproteobacteria bacterium]
MHRCRHWQSLFRPRRCLRLLLALAALGSSGSAEAQRFKSKPLCKATLKRAKLNPAQFVAVSAGEHKLETTLPSGSKLMIWEYSYEAGGQPRMLRRLTLSRKDGNREVIVDSYQRDEGFGAENSTTVSAKSGALTLSVIDNARRGLRTRQRHTPPEVPADITYFESKDVGLIKSLQLPLKAGVLLSGNARLQLGKQRKPQSLELSDWLDKAELVIRSGLRHAALKPRDGTASPTSRDPLVAQPSRSLMQACTVLFGPIATQWQAAD